MKISPPAIRHMENQFSSTFVTQTSNSCYTNKNTTCSWARNKKRKKERKTYSWLVFSFSFSIWLQSIYLWPQWFATNEYESIRRQGRRTRHVPADAGDGTEAGKQKTPSSHNVWFQFDIWYIIEYFWLRWLVSNFLIRNWEWVLILLLKLTY